MVVGGEEGVVYLGYGDIFSIVGGGGGECLL